MEDKIFYEVNIVKQSWCLSQYRLILDSIDKVNKFFNHFIELCNSGKYTQVYYNEANEKRKELILKINKSTRNGFIPKIKQMTIERFDLKEKIHITATPYMVHNDEDITNLINTIEKKVDSDDKDILIKKLFKDIDKNNIGSAVLTVAMCIYDMPERKLYIKDKYYNSMLIKVSDDYKTPFSKKLIIVHDNEQEDDFIEYLNKIDKERKKDIFNAIVNKL